ncbi:MAG: hypothetical protein VB140_02980 [Burkholderia sp.]
MRVNRYWLSLDLCNNTPKTSNPASPKRSHAIDWQFVIWTLENRP